MSKTRIGWAFSHGKPPGIGRPAGF